MYPLVAIFLLLHGLAHLVGFVGPWGLSNSVQPQSTLLAGRISIGVIAMRTLGIFWLGGALAFTVAAVGVLRHVVAGTRGAGLVERLLLGSVATRLMRHSTRSLLVVPDMEE